MNAGKTMTPLREALAGDLLTYVDSLEEGLPCHIVSRPGYYGFVGNKPQGIYPKLGEGSRFTSMWFDQEDGFYVAIRRNPSFSLSPYRFKHDEFRVLGELQERGVLRTEVQIIHTRASLISPYAEGLLGVVTRVLEDFAET